MPERKFSIDGKTLTIRPMRTDEGWTLQVFNDQEKPVFGCKAAVSFETEVDFAQVWGNLANHLLDFVEEEVKTEVRTGRLRI
jgi:hypothetical protein